MLSIFSCVCWQSVYLLCRNFVSHEDYFAKTVGLGSHTCARRGLHWVLSSLGWLWMRAHSVDLLRGSVVPLHWSSQVVVRFLRHTPTEVEVRVCYPYFIDAQIDVHRSWFLQDLTASHWLVLFFELQFCAS